MSYGIDRTDDLSTKSGYRHNGVFFNNRTTKKTNPTKNEVFVDDTIHHGAVIADSQSYTETKDTITPGLSSMVFMLVVRL